MMSILGLDSGYTVKYNPLPSGDPSGTPSGKGLYLTFYPSSHSNTDTEDKWRPGEQEHLYLRATL